MIRYFIATRQESEAEKGPLVKLDEGVRFSCPPAFLHASHFTSVFFFSTTIKYVFTCFSHLYAWYV